MSPLETTAFKYMLTVYGSQRAFNRPKFSHTYATFEELDRVSGIRTEAPIMTISWLPRDGKINPIRRGEPGLNFSFEDTETWLAKGRSNDRWKSEPTEITPELYFSARDRIAQLESGSVEYVMVDTFLTRPESGSNCIHAVSDLPLALTELRMAFTGSLHGIEASRFVYHYLSPYFVEPPPVKDLEEERFVAMQMAQPGLSTGAK
ncbi:MAG: hypothetical protein U0791_25390 [Gemmataceae bacterium]